MSDHTYVVIRVSKSFLYSSSVYYCHLFLLSSLSVRSLLFLVFIAPMFAWNVPLVSPVSLKRSLVFPNLLFSFIPLCCSLNKAFLALLAILWTLHSVGCIFPFHLKNTFSETYRIMLNEISGLVKLTHKINHHSWERLTHSVIQFSSVQFSRSVVSDSLWPHEPQHARPTCPSPTPGVHPNPCPLSWWCLWLLSASYETGSLLDIGGPQQI